MKKFCFACQTLKNKDEFYNSQTTKDGKRYTCIKCEKKRTLPEFKKLKDPRYWARERRKPYKNGKKECGKCKIYKSLREFPKNNQTWDKLHSNCKDCERARGKEKNIRLRSESPEKWISHKMYLWKRGARIRGRKLDFKVNKEDLIEIYHKQNGICPLSKVKMTYKAGVGGLPTNLSIDRITSKLGYTKKNTRFVCHVINILRHDLSDIQFLNLCKKIISYGRENK